MPPTPKGAKPPAFDETTCRQCQCFRERTKTADEVAWGECWSHPPEMREVVDDADQVDFVPVVKTVILPYRCYSDFKPLEH